MLAGPLCGALCMPVRRKEGRKDVCECEPCCCNTWGGDDGGHEEDRVERSSVVVHQAEACTTRKREMSACASISKEMAWVRVVRRVVAPAVARSTTSETLNSDIANSADDLCEASEGGREGM